jgi:hypothetical protein
MGGGFGGGRTGGGFGPSHSGGSAFGRGFAGPHFAETRGHFDHGRRDHDRRFRGFGFGPDWDYGYYDYGCSYGHPYYNYSYNCYSPAY